MARIDYERLEELKKIVGKTITKNGRKVYNQRILETDWMVDLYLEIETGEVSVEGVDSDESVGNIKNIYLIDVDEYARKILVYMKDKKDITMIDEDGGISNFGTKYIHKTKEMEREYILEYADIEVIPEDKYKIEGEPLIQWHGCFDKSFAYCLDKHYQGIETKLVHGICKAPIGSYSHGWVEIDDDIVFDGAMQRFYDKDGYYKKHDAKKEAEYTPEEASKNAIKFNRYNDWFEDNE